jgi:serine/threonine-protein kinase
LEAKLDQLRLERNHGEAIRLLQARLAQFHFASDVERGYAQVMLAFSQRFAGDGAGAKVNAEQARNTLEPLCKNQPNNSRFAALLALSYAALGNKDAALKEADRAIMLLPTVQDRWEGPAREEVLAVIQTTVGENSHAISNLTGCYNCHTAQRLLRRSLLRLDPLWDPLRADPAFQKLCEEK